MEPENLSSPAADDEAALQPSTAEAPDAEESSPEIRPVLFENPRRTATAPDADPPAADGLTEGFLTGLRPGVWD